LVVPGLPLVVLAGVVVVAVGSTVGVVGVGVTVAAGVVVVVAAGGRGGVGGMGKVAAGRVADVEPKVGLVGVGVVSAGVTEGMGGMVGWLACPRRGNWSCLQAHTQARCKDAMPSTSHDRELACGIAELLEAGTLRARVVRPDPFQRVACSPGHS
jgi:hypothetical protein